MPLSPGVHFLAPTIPLHVFEADEPGPTALIQAGIHGDEIAGVHALEELLEEDIRPERGRLLICPRMNPAAYRERKRAREGGLDLNRCFPGDPDAPEFERRLAHRFMQLVLDERPALVATLHESWKRYDPNVTPSFGQTLVYGVEQVPGLVRDVVDQMNTSKKSEDEWWATLYYPVATSSTEVIVDAIGCIGVCVETWMGFEEKRRIEMQKEVTLRMLDHLGVRRFG